MNFCLTLILILISFNLYSKEVLHCEYFYDEDEILHLKGEGEFNLYECIGYFHAKDRAYQMDYLRRIGLSQNAEVLGYDFLKSDLMMKLLQIENRAKKLYEDLDSDSKNLYISYANGVNQAFSTIDFSKIKEFDELGFKPQKWEPYHSLLILMLQSFSQTQKTFRHEIKEWQWAEVHKEKTMELFNELTMPWMTTILKENEYKTKKMASVIQPNMIPFRGEFIEEEKDTFGGSNSWIIGKVFSDKNVPVLANDPHLDLKRPSFWYWYHFNYKISGVEKNVIGGSIPGLPFILSGTNTKVSWGLTNSYYDTADGFFLPKVDEKDLKSIRPLVWFKLWFLKIPFFFKSFELTKNDLPILPLDFKTPNKMALRWSGFDLKPADVIGMKNVMFVESAKNMDDVLKTIGLPSWNYVFTDITGDIGYRVIGNLPKRTAKTFGPQTISVKDSAFEYLPHDENPRQFMPKRQLLVTANQRHYPIDGLYDEGQGHALSFRGFRAEELLNQKIKTKKKLSVEDMKDVQCDNEAVDARFLLPKMLNVLEKIKLSDVEKNAIELLKKWDFQSNIDCRICGVYRRTLDLLFEKNKINEVAFYNLLSTNSITIDDEFKMAVKEMYDPMLKSFKKWGEIHINHMPHISNDHRFKYPFSIPVPGDENSVNPGTAKFKDGKFEHFSGASHRIIVEMTNPPTIYRSHLGSNAGNYFDEKEKMWWEKWATCQFTKVMFPVSDKSLYKIITF